MTGVKGAERYDSTSARHYAAFRPPLHSLILERVIGPSESFQVGLDIGCGTGGWAGSESLDVGYGSEAPKDYLSPRIWRRTGPGDYGGSRYRYVRGFAVLHKDSRTSERTDPSVSSRRKDSRL
jgi:hypothetical protein